MPNFSQIVNEEQSNKIISYFPYAKRNFKISLLYSAQKDGWTVKEFKERVFDKGSTLIILKTSKGAICGGYTSKDWNGSGSYTNDLDAFVFNMNTKFIPINYDQAILTYSDGFSFGDDVLTLKGEPLNKQNAGTCYKGKNKGYDIEGDVSPLTNEEFCFTCEELEVYKVVYD